MDSRQRIALFVLILIPIIVIPLLGVHPRPRTVAESLVKAREALEARESLLAAKQLGRVAASLPWRKGLWETAGKAAYEGGDYLLAIDYLENARTAQHITPDGYLYLGDAFNATGDTQTAEQFWQTYLAVAGPDAAVHTRLLALHQAEGDMAAAIEDLQAILTDSPNNAQARYQLGLMLTAREPEAALVHLIQAVELDANLSDAVNIIQNKVLEAQGEDNTAYTFLNAGRALAFLGEWELAAEAFRRSTEEDPEYAEAWAFLGEAQQQIGEDGGAALERAITINPESFTANTLYGLYWSRNARYELALVYLHAAADLEPENPSTEAEIGNTLNAMGDIPGALQHFERAVEIDPRDPVYWRLLSQYALQNEIQIEEIGIASARSALILNPDDPLALDLMGYGYFLLNDFTTARRFLLQSLTFDAKNASAIFHLGLVEMNDGQLAYARDYFEQVILLAPGTQLETQAARILSQYFP